jgi:SAM-dependent methyltransferase
MGQFTYFLLQLGESDWKRKEVLDFGGNIGNLLRDPNSTVDEARYWCIDVSQEAVEAGRKSFPKANWIFYNRYCFFFNPNGIPKLPLPRLTQRFDYIVAYSVFTNTTRPEMLELVADLQNHLKTGGSLAFTFIDPTYHSWPEQYPGENLLWRLARDQQVNPNVKIDIEGIRKKVKDASWFVLVNGTDLFIEDDNVPMYPPQLQRTFRTFYSAQYIASLFPNARVALPTNNEMQHCCIIAQP